MRNKKIGLILLATAALLVFCVSAFAADEYRTFKQGDEGRDVLRFKQAMYWLGYFTTENVSDQYNGTTVERVKWLQRNNGLEETGIATPELQELVFSGQAVKTDDAPKPSPVPTPSPTPIPVKAPEASPSLPPLNEKGFLAENAGTEEFVYENEEDGQWIYITDSIAIDLRRYTDVENTLVWFEGDIKTSEETPLTAYLTNPTGKNPGKGYASPITLAKNNKVVLGITDDHFGDRWNGGARVGVIIRNGKIIKEQPRTTQKPTFPSLEVLAVFEDGSMKTFASDAHTGQEYLDMGVVNTYAFGPILVSEGQLGKWMLEENFYHYREPRCAIGMYEPHHYFLLVAKGRTDDSKGVYLNWLAEKMLEKGVVEGMNLDGGGTTALMFMGKILNKANRNLRSTSSITGFGVSELVGK